MNALNSDQNSTNDYISEREYIDVLSCMCHLSDVCMCV